MFKHVAKRTEKRDTVRKPSPRRRIAETVVFQEWRAHDSIGITCICIGASQEDVRPLSGSHNHEFCFDYYMRFRWNQCDSFCLAALWDVKTLILKFVQPSEDPRYIPSLNSFFAWQLRHISYLENLWGTATPHIEIGNTSVKKESCAVLRKIWNASVFHQKSKRCLLASENSCAALPIVW